MQDLLLARGTREEEGQGVSKQTHVQIACNWGTQLRRCQVTRYPLSWRVGVYTVIYGGACEIIHAVMLPCEWSEWLWPSK